MSLGDDEVTEVGGYKLERRLGAGGMGVVYLARSPRGTPVALKVVRREWAEDEAFRARFELEVAAARMVHSRYTAPVVDASPRGPDPWMATLYVPGRGLDTRVSEDGPLNGSELIELARALTQALADIHRAGVIHRDLKPSNILLTEDGPRVIDFGVAQAVDGLRLTETGHIVGTPAFMAPEQLQSLPLGPEADIFALGCVLTFAATGGGPFGAHGPFGVAYQAVHEEPDLAGVPDSLREVVADCLAKEPADRPSPASILKRLAEPAPPTTPKVGPSTRRRASARDTWTVLQRACTRRVPAWAVASSVLAAVSVTLVAAGTDNGQRPASPLPGHPHVVLANGQPWVTNLRGKASGTQCVSGDPDSTIRAFLYCLVDGRILGIETYHGETVWERLRPDGDNSGRAELIGVRDKELYYTTRASSQLVLRALGVKTGRLLWERRFTNRSRQVFLSHGHLLLMSSGWIKGLDSTARKALWTRPVTGEASVATLGGMAFLVVRDKQHTKVSGLQPATGALGKTVVLEDRLHLLGTANGLIALGNRSAAEADSTSLLLFDTARFLPDTATRTALRLHLQGRKFLLALGPDTAFLAYEDGHVSAVNALTGKERWSSSVQGVVAAAPVYAHEQLLVMTANGTVTTFKAVDGTRLEVHDPYGDSKSLEKKPLNSPEIIRNNSGAFYALTSDGLLYTLPVRSRRSSPSGSR